MKFSYYFILVAFAMGLSACQADDLTTAVPNGVSEEPTASIRVKKEEMAPKMSEAKNPIVLMPEGWQQLERQSGPVRVEGDLNKDGIQDVAMVIEKLESAKDQAPERALLIAFGNKDGTYTRSIMADKAILKADEGGIWGDPLAGISIDKGSIIVSFYGGSNDRWYGNYRFRFQDEDWYLIGATVGSFYSGTMTETTGDEEDYNLLTGDYVKRIVDDPKAEKNTSHTITGNMGKKKLLKLSDFVATGSTDQFLK
ncbi:hypothetical protein PAECIP111891_06745 [Paenibacillus allorhizoplanae]|uniref:Lipoprotein n=1 Tax=Paenibacillus allorhizoplanae TaxID=2905648 RepID=A0ABN8H5W7_9BACL|nr:hypothetical protein [Paenibacillus allorhizoplanae]CAH1230840.1 hypothetical protein PAECIP111891_06745 [Paenibacillus allorhizoplanae]